MIFVEALHATPLLFLPVQFPQHNSCTYGNIERMLGPELRDLHTYIALINHILRDTINLMAEDKRIVLIRVSNKIL
jgi:hypothetical protein